MSKSAAWLGIALALIAFVGVFVGFALRIPGVIALGTVVLVGLWAALAWYRRGSRE